MALIRPGSRYFVGREKIIDKLLESIRRNSAVLLYGGRQAGKTSLLLAVTAQLRATVARVSELSTVDIPVYIDLTALDYDATPSDFFGLLVAKTHEGFSAKLDSRSLSLNGFADGLSQLRNCCGEVDTRPVFLLDGTNPWIAFSAWISG